MSGSFMITSLNRHLKGTMSSFRFKYCFSVRTSKLLHLFGVECVISFKEAETEGLGIIIAAEIEKSIMTGSENTKSGLSRTHIQNMGDTGLRPAGN